MLETDLLHAFIGVDHDEADPGKEHADEDHGGPRRPKRMVGEFGQLIGSVELLKDRSVDCSE